MSKIARVGRFAFMTPKSWSAMAVVSALILPSIAQAATISCTTTVSGIAVSPGGTVVPTLDGMGSPYMCNLTAAQPTSLGPISIEICRAWVSMFITAKTSGQRVTLIFDYGTGAAPATCSAVDLNWKIPPVFPYYFNFAG
jgi:hypothetical protein